MPYNGPTMKKLLLPILIVLNISATCLASLSGKSSIENIYAVFPSLVEVQTLSFVLDQPGDSTVNDAKIRTGRRGVYARAGSGAILDNSGIIITNAHIIKLAHDIEVKLSDGTKLKAVPLAISENSDLALIRIVSGPALHPIKLSDPSQIKLNSPVYSVGNSVFLKGTMIQGKVTGFGKRKNQPGSEIHMIQTNIQMYPGDSGGPVLNKQGELVGIMFAGRSARSKQSYAVPSNVIKNLYETYMTRGKTSS
jgi:S1-C subfamily serine protease